MMDRSATQVRCERAGQPGSVLRMAPEALAPALEWQEVLVTMQAAPISPADLFAGQVPTAMEILLRPLCSWALPLTCDSACSSHWRYVWVQPGRAAVRGRHGWCWHGGQGVLLLERIAASVRSS